MTKQKKTCKYHNAFLPSKATPSSSGKSAIFMRDKTGIVKICSQTRDSISVSIARQKISTPPAQPGSSSSLAGWLLPSLCASGIRCIPACTGSHLHPFLAFLKRSCVSTWASALWNLVVRPGLTALRKTGRALFTFCTRSSPTPLSQLVGLKNEEL